MKKGFTLIELLAVIIIIAIISLIAAPIVLNIINDSKNDSMLRSSEMYLDAVELSIYNSTLNGKRIKDGTYQILESGNICIGTITDNKCTDELLVKAKGELPISGTITVERDEIKKHSLMYRDSIKIVNGELKVAVCNLVTDNDKDGIADTGDMITCSTESFHVIENDGTTISMLAQYNLNIGSPQYPNENTYGLQDEHALGTKTGYDEYGKHGGISDNYWYDCKNDILKSEYGSTYPVWVYTDQDGNRSNKNSMYSYIDAYEEYLINEKVNSASATVISYEQLIYLGCTDTTCIDSEYDWVYFTSYLTGSTKNSSSLLTVNSSGRYGGTNNSVNFHNNGSCGFRGPIIPFGTSTYNYGIRPVINISVNEL